MTEENIIEFKCPHCGIIIEVKGCSTCVHNERNMNNYLEAKACWECDMFHKNYKKKGEEEFCAVPIKRNIHYLIRDEMGKCWEAFNPEDYDMKQLKLIKTEVHRYYE